MATGVIKTAFVLGAGLGTRLRSLTETIPKPLIPIFNKPLITFALDHLIGSGVTRFVINTHRLADQFTECFAEGRYAGYSVDLINEPILLETGGGIKNAEALLEGGPFITYSGDILSDVRVETLVEEHFRQGNDVTLGLRDTGLGSDVAVRDGRVVDIGKRYGIPGEHDFANIAVWNPDIFGKIPAAQKISFISVLADWIGKNGKIGGVQLNDGNWFNVGSSADYLHVHRTILKEQWHPSFVRDSAWPQPIHPTAEIAPNAKLVGSTVIGPHCRVGADAVLEDTILWTGSQIASRSQLSGCIVRCHQTADGVYRDAVI